MRYIRRLRWRAASMGEFLGHSSRSAWRLVRRHVRRGPPRRLPRILGRTCNRRLRPSTLASKPNAGSRRIAIMPSPEADFSSGRIGRGRNGRQVGAKLKATAILRIPTRVAAITSTLASMTIAAATGRGLTFAPSLAAQASTPMWRSMRSRSSSFWLRRKPKCTASTWTRSHFTRLARSIRSSISSRQHN